MKLQSRIAAFLPMMNWHGLQIRASTSLREAKRRSNPDKKMHGLFHPYGFATYLNQSVNVSLSAGKQ
jgi:hypothetical protein